MTAELEHFHEGFFADSVEALEAMESALQRLQPGTADRETINTVFRVAHSIKGGAGMLGLDDIAAFTHAMESLLDALRAGRMLVTDQVCAGLLQCVDHLYAMIAATRARRPLDPARSSALQQQLHALVAAGQAPLWRIRFRPLAGLLTRGNDPLRLFEDLAGMGALRVQADLGRVPALAELDPERCDMAWDLTLATAMPRDSIELMFEWARGDCELTIVREVQPAGDAVANARRGDTAKVTAATTLVAPAVPAMIPAQAENPAGTSIRVAISKLDDLQHAATDIMAIQVTLSELAGLAAGPLAEQLHAATARLEASARHLQDGVLRVRRLPVGSVFTRFPRLVRDLSARLGKQVRIRIAGSTIELDKALLEKIGDPLVHLVRNSVDHGIETPAVRIAAGKSPEGTVQLEAFMQQDAIHIVVRDDGRGLDRNKLLDKARSGGLIGPEPVLTDSQVHELIFLPGLSTSDQTNEVSGRGVGMDVVRRNIEGLGGTVHLASEPGRGTTVSIRLPLPAAGWRNAPVAISASNCA